MIFETLRQATLAPEERLFRLFLVDQKGAKQSAAPFPYGETWAEEKKNQTDLPYKFTGDVTGCHKCKAQDRMSYQRFTKELDPETGLYYFGARYYDPVLSKWISADPAFQKYLPKPGDHDDEHDYYWAHRNDQTSKLPGIGGVFNPGNLNLYSYSLNNPVKYTDPDGNDVITFAYKRELAFVFGKQMYDGIAIEWDENGNKSAHFFKGWNLSVGFRADVGIDVNYSKSSKTFKEFLESNFVTFTFDRRIFGGGVGLSTEGKNNILGNFSVGKGFGASYGLPQIGDIDVKDFKDLKNIHKAAVNLIKARKRGDLDAVKNNLNIIIKEIIKARKNQ